MRPGSPLRTAVIWISLLVMVTFLLDRSEGGAMPALFTLLLLFFAVFAVGAWSARRNLAKIYSYLALGRPDDLLALIEPRLRRRRSLQFRGPLIVFKAAALSMKGAFDEGLETLKEVSPDDLPEPGKKAWQFGYFSAMMSCLLFSDRIDEARRVFEDEIEPLADDASLRGTRRALEAARAELAFCDGDYTQARPVFERLVDDATMPPASRALFHYFLGRIHSDEERADEADEQFQLARKLGPHTWIPRGIDALAAETS